MRALTHALEHGRLHHAYLFTGTRGIGKTTVSRILAKSLNCIGPDGHGGVTSQPCGVCAPCREIDTDRHVDYVELDAASNRSIDEIRDLIERAAYKPTVGRYKVFMIDEAHQLTKDAFNALLKTLEEPPDYLKFVLATTDPERMLPTVLSRCLQFNLRPMAPEVVREHLERVLQSEGVVFDVGSLRLIGRAARGSMRDALSLTDQAIAYGGGQLVEAGVAAMLGLAGREACDDVLRALAQRDGPGVVASVQALCEAGVPPASALEQMAQWLQQVALAQVAPQAVELQGPERALLTALAGHFAPDEVQLLYSIVLHGRGELSLMSDEYAAFTMVLLRYLAFPGPDAARAPQIQQSLEPPGAAPSAPAGPTVRSAALRIDAPTAVRSAVAWGVPGVSRPPGGADVPAATSERLAPASRPVPDAAMAPRSTAHEASSTSHRGAPIPAVAAAGTTGPDTDDPPIQWSAPQGEAPTSANPHPEELAQLASRWDAAARQMSAAGALSGLVRELAWQSTLVAIEPGDPPVWRLRVSHESLRGQALRTKLAEALGGIEGGPVRIETDPGDPHDTPSQRDAALRAHRQQEAEHEIREDPLVRELLAQFATARIVPGSIRPL